MAISALVHTATRVIKNLTTDVNPVAPVDHTYIVVPDGFNLAGGPWKLDVDNVTKIAAVQAEINTAYTLTQPTEVLNLKTAAQSLWSSADTVAKDATLPADVRQMAADLRVFLVALRDAYKASIVAP